MARREGRPHELAYYSSGRWYLPQLYVIGWREIQVIKVGITSIGKRRYGRYLTRGGELLELLTFGGLGHLESEIRISSELEGQYELAFEEKADAIEFLGGRGEGWTECFSVPTDQWTSVLALLGDDPA